jgi:hypothetical protein
MLLQLLQVPVFSISKCAVRLLEEPLHYSIEFESTKRRSTDELVVETETRAQRITPPHTKTLRRLFTFEAPSQFFFSAYSSHLGLKGSGESILEQKYSTSEEMLKTEEAVQVSSPNRTTITQPSASDVLQLRPLADKQESEGSSSSSSESKKQSSDSSSISEHAVSDHRSVNRFMDVDEKEKARVSTRASSSEIIRFWKKPKFIFGSLQNLSEEEELLDPWIIEDELPFKKLKPKFLEIACRSRRRSRPLNRIYKYLFRSKSLDWPSISGGATNQSFSTLQCLEEDFESDYDFLKAALKHKLGKKQYTIEDMELMHRPSITEFGWLGLTQWVSVSTRSELLLHTGVSASRGRPAHFHQQALPRLCLV